MYKTAWLGFVIAASVVAVACGGDDGGDGDGTFNLEWEGNGYGMAHDGDTLFFTLWDDGDDTAPVASMSFTVMGGGGGGGGGGGDNAVTFADALTSGAAYTLYWYADVDGNSMCDMAGDHHWSEAIPAVSAEVTITHGHDVDFDGDCARHP